MDNMDTEAIQKLDIRYDNYLEATEGGLTCGGIEPLPGPGPAPVAQPLAQLAEDAALVPGPGPLLRMRRDPRPLLRMRRDPRLLALDLLLGRRPGRGRAQPRQHGPRLEAAGGPGFVLGRDLHIEDEPLAACCVWRENRCFRNSCKYRAPGSGQVNEVDFSLMKV